MPENMWQNPERLGREQTMDITAEVEGNHSNFEQNLAVSKRTFFHLKSQQKAVTVCQVGSQSSGVPKVDN